MRLQGEGGDRLDGGIGQLELDAVETEEVLVLGDQRVLGLGHDAHELAHSQVLNGGDDGQTTDELGDETELMEGPRDAPAR